MSVWATDDAAGNRGGPAEPPSRVDAWLVTDERAELIATVRRLARARGIAAEATDVDSDHLRVRCHPVVHTSHPTFGYLINSSQLPLRVVWAPEFAQFPSWASGADLMFAPRAGIGRLVFAHIGRPTIRAIDQGERPPFGEFARDAQVFLPRARPLG